jgi:hypothetical protein
MGPNAGEMIAEGVWIWSMERHQRIWPGLVMHTRLSEALKKGYL